MEMPGESRDVNVALVLEVVDRDQDCVLDARQLDQAGVAVAHRLQPRGERQRVVDHLAEGVIRAAGQQLRARHGQRRLGPVPGEPFAIGEFH